jgi:hypothetical protein
MNDLRQSGVWVRHLFTRRCVHPSDDVTADILEGDFHGGPGRDQAVQWCRRCGAHRRVFDVWGQKPRYSEWEAPYA